MNNRSERRKEGPHKAHPAAEKKGKGASVPKADKNGGEPARDEKINSNGGANPPQKKPAPLKPEKKAETLADKAIRRTGVERPEQTSAGRRDGAKRTRSEKMTHNTDRPGLGSNAEEEPPKQDKAIMEPSRVRPQHIDKRDLKRRPHKGGGAVRPAEREGNVAPQTFRGDELPEMDDSAEIQGSKLRDLLEKFDSLAVNETRGERKERSFVYSNLFVIDASRHRKAVAKLNLGQKMFGGECDWEDSIVRQSGLPDRVETPKRKAAGPSAPIIVQGTTVVCSPPTAPAAQPVSKQSSEQDNFSEQDDLDSWLDRMT